MSKARALYPGEGLSNPSDLGAAENIFAQVGVQPKPRPKLVSKFLRAREYRKANQALFQAAKTLADLSLDSQRPGSSSAPGREDVDRDRVVGVAASVCRIYLWCKDAFPTSRQKDEWAADVWREACERTGANRDLFIQPELFSDSSMKLFLETKKNISNAVEVCYDFDASRSRGSRNADLASALLRDMSFVYRDNHRDRTLHHPYQHPVIQKAINITWFCDSVGDGLVFNKHFSPLPVPAIAFIVTTIQCCIDEWSNDSHTETNWEEEQFNTVYQSHRDALDKFRQRDNDFFEQFRSSLRKEAYKHAGVETTPPRRSDLLNDGFVARTFTAGDANKYFMLLLRTPQPQSFLEYYGIEYHRGAWYIRHNSKLVQGASPVIPYLPTPLLDYSMRETTGTVVPQRQWTPAEEVDIRRHVESAALLLPIFFVNRNGSLGFSIPDILRGCDRELHNANSFAPLGGKYTTSVRIHWPGYRCWRRQIPARDETHARNPITMARFMKHIGSSVDKFFRECMLGGYVATEPRWQIGMPNGIKLHEVKVVGAIHVSAGSWMPIIQLTQHII